MAVGQAVGAFELFTGLEPDPARMEAHFRRLLAERAGQPEHTRRRAGHDPAPTAKPSATLPNPLGLDGIEFVEYATAAAAGARPGARDDGLPAGRAAPLARGAAVPAGRHERRHQRPRRRAAAQRRPAETPVIAAIALRVRDAARRLQARARARRLGGADARRGDGAATSRRSTASASSRIYFVDRWRRVLDLRRRLRADPHRRHAAAGARRPALVRHRAVHRQRPHGRLERVLPRAVRLRRAARRSSASASCRRAASCRARAAASTCS